MELLQKTFYNSLYYTDKILSVNQYKDIISISYAFVNSDIYHHPDSPFRKTCYLSLPVFLSTVFFGKFSYAVHPLDENKMALGYIILNCGNHNISAFGYYDRPKKLESLYDTFETDRYYGISNSEIRFSSVFSSHDLPYLNEICWSSLADCGSLSNHCGPTSGTNVMQYMLRYSGAENTIDVRRTTEKLYHDMKTGRLGTFPLGYFSSVKKFMSFNFKQIKFKSGIIIFHDWKHIKSVLNRNGIITSYTWSSSYINGAHYINYVGWREYDGKMRFLRVLNQWDHSSMHFMRFNYKSLFHISALFSFIPEKAENPRPSGTYNI